MEQKKYRLTFLQLRTPNENEPLGEALTEAIRQGLQQVVQAENINPAQYSLLLAIHSNSFTNIWAQSARGVPLNEWLHNQEYARAYLEQLARKLNSAQMIDPEKDGFFVELTLSKPWGVEEEMVEKRKTQDEWHGKKWPERKNASYTSKTTIISVLPGPS